MGLVAATPREKPAVSVNILRLFARDWVEWGQADDTEGTLARAGGAVETTRGGLVDIDWSNLGELYDRLGTIDAVAQYLGCGRKKVYNEMRRRGIPSKSRGHRPPKPISCDNLGELYDQLGTIRSLASALKRGENQVRRELKRRGIPAKPRGFRKGQPMPDYWIESHRRSMSTPEKRESSRKHLLERLPKMDGSTNSPIERLLHDALIRAGVSFETQQLKLGRYLVDIELLSVPVIIEADGALHQLTRSRMRDALRDADLQTAGYRVFRFSGTQIHADPDACIRRVVEACGLVVPEIAPVARIYHFPVGENNPGWRGGPQTYTCNWCGTIFQRQRSHRVCKNTYCCHRCYGDWRRAHPEQNPVLVRWARAKQRADETVI